MTASPAVVKSERTLSVWAAGVERGEKMLEFLRERMTLDETSAVLDIGAGKGGISIAIASEVGSVDAVELAPDRLKLFRARLAERDVANLRIHDVSALDLPFDDGTFDLVLINGVLEYMGLADTNRSPDELQEQALREARRVLRPGGVLYLAIENRWWPSWLLRDPHADLPLVAWLPRFFANAFSKLCGRGGYRHHIHSLRGLHRRLQNVGFADAGLRDFLPIVIYQFPLAILPADDHRTVCDALRRPEQFKCSDAYRSMALGKRPWKRHLFRMFAMLRLQRAFAPGFVLLATKSAGETATKE